MYTITSEFLVYSRDKLFGNKFVENHRTHFMIGEVKVRNSIPPIFTCANRQHADLEKVWIEGTSYVSLATIQNSPVLNPRVASKQTFIFQK